MDGHGYCVPLIRKAPQLAGVTLALAKEFRDWTAAQQWLAFFHPPDLKFIRIICGLSVWQLELLNLVLSFDPFLVGEH